MAYYAALLSLVQLLEDITHHDSYPNSRLQTQQMASLYAKFNLLHELLDEYSAKDHEEESVDILERRIRDVSYRAQDILESQISNPIPRKKRKGKGNGILLQKVMEEVDSILEELMRFKVESHKTHKEDLHLQKSNNSVSGDLLPLVQLLEEISHHNRYPKFRLDKAQIASLHEKFKLLQEFLDKEEETTDILERRIRDATERTQDIIGTHISNQKHGDLTLTILAKGYHDLKKVKEEVDFIVKELMRIKMETLTTNEDNLKKIPYSANRASTQEEGLQRSSNISADSVGGASKVEAPSGRNTMADNLQKILYSANRASTQEEGLQGSSNISADKLIITRRRFARKSLIRQLKMNVGGASKVEAPSGRNTMVGFEDHLKAVNEQLCGQSVKLEVISIVGMGGLGKTTLARNIFDSKLIHDYFDCRVWVTISQDYHRPKVLQGIASSMNIKEEEGLAEHIRKHLFGRRYLIVIDDIWDIKVWNDIKRIFPDTSDKSRIILTTRLSDVALYAGNPKFLHQMQFLNESQSWTLLQQKVFGQKHCPEELEAIGKLIAESCRGLPLGIVVIAGVLSNVNKVPNDWQKIARHVSSVAIDQNDKHLSNILSLSYNHLPHHLKPCFLYLSGFPEDHAIHISQLIRLWVAEGFLRPIESKSLEEVGEEYLKDLANRNLVFFTKKKFNGKFKYCSVHDLVRDLCSQRAHYENFLHCLQENNVHHESMGNVYRVFATENSLFLKYTAKHYSTIRSVISFSFSVDQYFLSATTKCKLLRILDASKLSAADYGSIDEIFELLHLRYLTLHAKSNIHISPSICKLWKLQTLIVEGISVSLPCEIWKMSQLRHLILLCLRIPPIPYGEISIIDGIPLLRRLQTLQGVKGFIFTRHTIEMIPNLKKLAVYYTTTQDQDYASWEEVGLNNLVHLHQLEKLEIYFDWFKPGIPLPENFAFPSSLIKLNLFGCRLPWKDMRVVGSLPNLQVLKLYCESFEGEEWEPIEGEFRKLKLLLMERLYDLKYWRAENIHFSCLEQLYIKSCYKLKEIPSEIADIPTLQYIEVIGCNSAVDSSVLKILVEQRDQGNDDFQVRIEPRTW